jgi:hypothetical protein
MRLVLAAALALLLVPMAGAQGHAHGGASGVLIVADALVGGQVHAGDLAQFSVLAVGDDAVPDFHQGIPVRVTLNGVVLFETTPDSGHDYDGIQTFAVTFPVPGPYRVEALGDDGSPLAVFEGVALAGEPRPAQARIDGPASVPVGALAEYTMWPEDLDGRLLEHFYALFEVRDGASVVYRAKLHGHGGHEHGALRAAVAFPRAGSYDVTAVLFQADTTGPQPQQFLPVAHTLAVDVTMAPPQPAVPVLPPAGDRNRVVEAAGTKGRLLGTFDPYAEVGPTTMQHIAVLALDEADRLVRHVDFKGELLGPLGQVLFSSEHLHETDGLLDFATTQPAPGVYTFRATDPGGAVLEAPYVVRPPVEALSVGPQALRHSGLADLSLGVPANALLSIRDLAGRPFDHGEVDLVALGPGGAPWLMAKLHTHADGDYAFAFTAPGEGSHTPFPLEARPTTFDVAPVVFTVGPGPGLPEAPVKPSDDVDAPALPLVLLLAAFVLAAARRR